MTDGTGNTAETVALEAAVYALSEKLDAIDARLERMDAKLERMLGLYDAIGIIAAGVPPRLVAALYAMTPAEHVALQMVLDNRSNREISVCLDVPEAQVKTWIDSMIAKLGVKDRRDIRALMYPVMAKVPAADYIRASGGIPKDWNDKYGVGGIPDPFRRIYHPD
ncbi:helix-turn-helix transcriptional regulator [Tropicimonas isoalkanivorans]|uniref:DNA-binding transcriptional regulator, CsgD family n=1 Tax=Tropicimonas isoalkanivorans TaxID=441112 RepID=A0A1I1DC36_9RHOB|nr:LuxR C-terminal-related transcriptional regulator [Tropicimonas isoalkanivorans]SFB70648.1 DNA-binding transcriptional regulator, CsgD family [Tropicimonas isoalkanivorans]